MSDSITIIQSYRSPKARALHDFILGYIKNSEFDKNCWENGYQSRCGEIIDPWKRAFYTTPVQPPSDYPSAIRLLMQDCCTKNPINFSWLQETGTAGHSTLMLLVDASFKDNKTGKKRPNGRESANKLLDALLLQVNGVDAEWVKTPAFVKSFGETVAIIQSEGFTLLTHATKTGDFQVFERVLALYEHYNKQVLKSHIAQITKDGFHPLADAAITGDLKILTKICELYRTHLDKETIQAHLKQYSHPHELNMMHQLLSGKLDGKKFRHNLSKEGVTEAMRLYIYAFGEDKGKETIQAQLYESTQGFRKGNFVPNKGDWNIDTLIDRAIEAEREKIVLPPNEATKAGQTSSSSSGRIAAFNKKWGVRYES